MTRSAQCVVFHTTPANVRKDMSPLIRMCCLWLECVASDLNMLALGMCVYGAFGLSRLDCAYGSAVSHTARLRAPQPRPPASAEPALYHLRLGAQARRWLSVRSDVSRHGHRGPQRRRHTPPVRRVSMRTTNRAISSPSPHHTYVALCEHLHLASHAPPTITGTRIHARPRLASYDPSNVQRRDSRSGRSIGI
jgi:hypothetical protein